MRETMRRKRQVRNDRKVTTKQIGSRSERVNPSRHRCVPLQKILLVFARKSRDDVGKWLWKVSIIFDRFYDEHEERL